MTCVEDIDDWSRISKAVLYSTEGIENDTAEASEEDDFIVQVEISDDDYAAYQQYKVIEHIRGRIRNRYISNLAIPSFYSSVKKEISESIQEEDVTIPIRHRKATSEEKRFERFIKRKVRNISREKSFFDDADYEHLFGLITAIFEIIQKNRSGDELIEDIFVDSYVIETRIALLEKLIQKNDGTDPDDELVRLTLQTILDNHARIENLQDIADAGGYELKNRQLLVFLDKKFSLRQSYEEKLFVLEQGTFTLEAQERFLAAKQYLESLFGYKALGQIQEYMTEQYGPESVLLIKDGIARVSISTDSPGKFFKPDDSLLRELAKYSANVAPVNTIQMVISNTGISKIDRIEHVMNLEYRRLTTTTVWRSGRSEKGKPVYYSF